MRYFYCFLILIFISPEITLLLAQREVRGEYIANIGAQYIDSTNIDLIQKIEISTEFKVRYDNIRQENNFVIVFLPQSSSNRLLIKESGIKEIKNYFGIKFNISLYEKISGLPIMEDSLISEISFNEQNAGTLKVIESISTNPIIIANYCSKVKYIRFPQVQIIKKPFLIRRYFVIEECDTLYSPNFEKTNDSKPNEINRKSITLKPFEKNKDIVIFGGTILVYGSIWLYLHSLDNAPKQIPFPPDFPK